MLGDGRICSPVTPFASISSDDSPDYTGICSGAKGARHAIWSFCSFLIDGVEQYRHSTKADETVVGIGPVIKGSKVLSPDDRWKESGERWGAVYGRTVAVPG